MESSGALAAFAALAQPTRLEAVRHLIRAEPEGLAAGALAQALGVPPNTLSAHLAVLANAGLVTGRRLGRTITYRAEPGQVRDLADYLMQDCCGGRPDLCAPVPAAATCPSPGDRPCPPSTS